MSAAATAMAGLAWGEWCTGVQGASKCIVWVLQGATAYYSVQYVVTSLIVSPDTEIGEAALWPPHPRTQI